MRNARALFLRPALLLLLGASSACAGSVAGRSFERAEARQVPLRRIDVIVVGAKPQSAGDRFDVDGFAPPKKSELLIDRAEDPQVRDALARAIRATLEAKGYRDIRILTSEGPSPADAGLLPPVASTTVAATSTSGVTRLTARPPTSLPTRPRPTAWRIDETTTLLDVLGRSDADAVLVVRAVPVDEFGLIEEQQVQTIGGPDNASLNQTTRTVHPMRGRLMVGQAFLYLPKTGTRLWTRQAPDFPDANRLVIGHPFLDNGIVLAPGETMALDTLAAGASARFSDEILAELPKPTDGDPALRDRLWASGTTDEALQSFMDESHLGLSLAFEYGVENVELGLSFAGDALAPLNTKDVAPAGSFRLVPRLSFWGTQRLIWTLEVPLGFAPSNFGRTLYRDDPDGGPSDPIVRFELGGVVQIGVRGQVGWQVPLSRGQPKFFLVPRGGVDLSFWLIDATPSGLVDTPTRVRGALIGGADLLFLPSPDGRLFLRLGGDGRLGFDLSGSALFGFAAALGVGVLL